MQFQNTPELEGPFMHTGHLIPFLEISKEVREDVLRQLEHPLNEG